MRLVHISPSALAGAPGMLSSALEDFGLADQSVHFRAGDYKLERNVMSPETLPISDNARDRELFECIYKEADVVHIHNFCPPFVMSWIAELGVGPRKFVYQIHSPLFERPTFDALADYHGIHFHQKLVVCHFHPRQNPAYKIVPNCLYRKRYDQLLNVRSRDHRLIVFYSPSTRKSGRWTEKTNEAFRHAMLQFSGSPEIRLETFEGVSPQALASFRPMADVTIDEVVTGSYHLVSYEGLAAGTAVINGADPLSIAAFRMAFKSPEPPFIVASPSTIAATLLGLHRDRDKLREIKLAGRRFFEDWMSPKRVASIFAELYAS